MNLTEATRLVRRIESYLSDPDESLDPAKTAKEYASVLETASKRLVTCQRIIRDGDRDQALRLAMDPPPLMELINCLAFRKARDWVALCKQRGWPFPNPIDREAVQTLQQTYAEGGQADQDFVRRYRGAVLARDWPKAYDALQAILTAQPNDPGYRKEEERLRKLILDEIMTPISLAVEQGDVQEVIRLSGEVEALPFKPTFTGNTWPNAQIMRCGKMLTDAENRKNAEDLKPVISLTGRVKDLIEKYGLNLPVELANQMGQLQKWAAAETHEREQQEKHDGLISELRHLLQKSEESLQMTNVNPDLKARKIELDNLVRIWRELEDSRRGIQEALEDQYLQITILLRGLVSRKQRTHRNIRVAVAALALIVVAVAGFMFLQVRSANSMADELAALIEARKVQAAESLAKNIREKHSRLASFSNLKAVLEQVDPFCNKERSDKKELLDKIAGVAQLAGDGFKKPSLKEIQQEIDTCTAGINNLPEEFKPDAARAFATVQNEWERHCFAIVDERNMRFSQELGPAENTVKSLLEYDLPPASTSNKLEVLLGSVERMSELIPFELELKIKDEYIERFAVLTNQVANFQGELNTLGSGRNAMLNSDNLESFFVGVKQLQSSKAMTSEQKKALSNVLSAGINRDQLMKALLMPGLNNAWKRFTKNQALQTSPNKMMPSEIALLNTLLTNSLINEMRIGKVRDVKYENLQPKRGPWRPVFMFDASNTISKTKGKIAWANLYDPAKFPNKLVKEYYNMRMVLEFDFSTDTNTGLPASLPESKLLNRLGLSQVSAGKPMSMTGVLDKIHNDKDSSPVFKKYITEILMNIIDLRSGEWDTYWLTNPSLRAYRNQLGKINCCNTSGDWLVPDVNKKNAPEYWAKKIKAPPAKPSSLENFFNHYNKISLEESARMSHQIVLKPYNEGFTLAGFVELDHAGDEKLRLRKATEKQLWGWDTNGKPTKLYVWNQEKGHDKAVASTPMPFGPLFIFNGDTAAIKAALLNDSKKTGYSNEELEAWFPPLYQ